MKPKPKPSVSRGFALVVALSLMILLTIIAVGLLTLSSVSLRAASQGEAMATARGNARLALMLAIGELQKAAGPDQRVTAPATLVDATSSPGITGVWESWKPSPDGGNDHDGRKRTLQTTPESADGEFVSWLASGNVSSAVDPRKPPGAASASNNTVTLVSERVNGSETHRGTHLPPLSVNKKGDMAWTVMDEGVKARVDLPAESKTTDAAQRLARLRAPARPQPEAIATNLEGLRVNEEVASRIVSMNQAELALGRPKELRPNVHDITPYSASLPVNVADGGLKGDLTRAFESSKLPTDLTSRYVYSNGKTRLAPADPLFSTLAGYYQLYKKRNNPLELTVPSRYTPMRGTVPNLAAHDGALVAPVVTRTSVVFSLVSRQAHGNWFGANGAGPFDKGDIFKATNDPQRNRMIYLIYTPVVTVYNPYSVPIQFRDLKVTFRNLPVAFKFFRNGVAQTNNHTLLNTFHILSESNKNWEDKFSSTMANQPGSSSDTMVTLYPGEARVFGTSHSSSTTWGAMTNYLWTGSLDASKTLNMNSGAGWDYRSGFIVDWLRPVIGGRTADNANLGVFAARPTDTINVEVMPMMPGQSNGKFAVEFQAKVSGSDMPLGIYEYNYGNEQKLRQVLENGNHTTSGKITFPFRRERDFTVSELTLSNPDNTPISRWGSAPKQFAIFTLGARTAHDTLYPGKPGRTTSFVHHVLQQDATRAHPALLPMEMSLLPITGSGANTVGSIDADDVNRAFYFSGTSRGTGAIHYVSQNVPTAPLMNLADFRHANLASSGHLPLVQHTVGESLASPMVPPDKTRSSSPFGYEVVDHAWYSNQTLWDGYFFSGIRNQSDASLLFANRPMPLNPRLTPLPGSGMDSTKAAQFALSDAAWSDLASMLAIKGGFNVNSTSKHAWKAVLSSLSGLDFPVLGPIEIRDPAVNPATYREKIVTAQDAAFPRLSRPISDRVDANNSFDNQRRWSGFRELSDKEIDTLAETIVTEIRSRGPFLSLAEFVNRRASSATDDLSARGLLEEAIRKSKLNEIRMGAANRVIDEAEAATFGYANPKAAAGNTEEGASAFISQGDLLSAIGASITVRSDTFVIRAYGAAREGNRVTASTWCEAVVQRLPSFVDPADAATKVQAASLQSGRTVNDLTQVNQRFGRRFEIVSFRWLTVDEV